MELIQKQLERTNRSLSKTLDNPTMGVAILDCVTIGPHVALPHLPVQPPRNFADKGAAANNIAINSKSR